MLATSSKRKDRMGDPMRLLEYRRIITEALEQAGMHRVDAFVALDGSEAGAEFQLDDGELVVSLTIRSLVEILPSAGTA